jgi:hypothetical protein
MREPTTRFDRVLAIAVGATAVAAPLLHSLTDALEWYRGGFTPWQLRLNYAAFLPMPWLLLGLYAVQPARHSGMALAGALLYGAAFAYFGHTTLYALREDIATYEALWARLGFEYTLFGALMVAGGLLFAAFAWRATSLPRAAVAAFAAGLVVNLVLALVPAPDILQTIGTAVRNAGLVGMGCAVLSNVHAREAR